MIVIPMLGRSSRFFQAGYTSPKYQLPLWDGTVFTASVRSFQAQFDTTPFLFLVRSDFNAKAFVADEVARLGIRDFRITQFDAETDGQAESVWLGTQDYHDDVPLIIFNIDTVRHDFTMPAPDQLGDGFLEVFHAPGEGWSFVEPGPNGTVLRTTEKDRISDLCCNGMYGFARLGDYRLAYKNYVEQGLRVKGELYVAPLYNILIQQGRSIRYTLLPPHITRHCGIPADYTQLQTESQAPVV